MTGPVGVAPPMACPPDAAPHVPEGAATYSTELNAGPHTSAAAEPEQSADVYPTAAPPHAEFDGAPHAHAEHPRESLAPTYSNCFVPKGHVKSPACSAQTPNPVGAAGMHAFATPHPPAPIGIVGLHDTTVCAHVIGGTFTLGCGAQLALDGGFDRDS